MEGGRRMSQKELPNIESLEELINKGKARKLELSGDHGCSPQDVDLTPEQIDEEYTSA